MTTARVGTPSAVQPWDDRALAVAVAVIVAVNTLVYRVCNTNYMQGLCMCVWLYWLSYCIPELLRCIGNTSVISDRSTMGSNPVGLNDVFLV